LSPLKIPSYRNFAAQIRTFSKYSEILPTGCTESSAKRIGIRIAQFLVYSFMTRPPKMFGGGDVKQPKKMPIVGAVMTSFPYFVESDDTVIKLERMMDEHGIRHLPVQKNGRLVGIVSERDLHHVISRMASAEAKLNSHARDIMIAVPYVAAFNTPLNEVVAQMARRHIGSVIVLRRGKLAGILSSIDVCRIFAEYLEGQFAPASGFDAA
jgi:acetoin utilization protein AcuB